MNIPAAAAVLSLTLAAALASAQAVVRQPGPAIKTLDAAGRRR